MSSAFDRLPMESTKEMRLEMVEMVERSSAERQVGRSLAHTTVPIHRRIRTRRNIDQWCSVSRALSTGDTADMGRQELQWRAAGEAAPTSTEILIWAMVMVYNVADAATLAAWAEAAAR